MNNRIEWSQAGALRLLFARKSPLLFDETRSWTVEELLLLKLPQSSDSYGGMLAVSTTSSISGQLAAILQAWQQQKTPVLFSPYWPQALRASSWASLCSPSSSSPPAGRGRQEEFASILFTSGSTGKPKAIAHSFRNHLSAAQSSHEFLPFGPLSTWLVSLPFYHIGGLQLVFRALLHGGTLVSFAGRVSVGLAHHKPSHISLVDKQLQEILTDGAALDAAKKADVILVGGGPISSTTAKGALELGLNIRVTYGSTEACAQVMTASSDAPLQLDVLLPSRALKIAEGGAVCIRGPQIAEAQWVNGAWESLVDEQGWFSSRDRGRLHRGGRLELLGRLDLQFISGGENVQPEAIETALCSLPEIMSAVVVPVPDALFGERPFAFLALKDGASLPDIAAIRARLKSCVARHELPVGRASLPDFQLKASRRELGQLAKSLYGKQNAGVPFG